MNDIITMIANQGIGVVCVAYLIYFQSTTMKDITKTLQEMTSELKEIKCKIGED